MNLGDPQQPIKTWKAIYSGASTFEAVREATGLVRPPGSHGCKPVEILPGLWTVSLMSDRSNTPKSLIDSFVYCFKTNIFLNESLYLDLGPF